MAWTHAIQGMEPHNACIKVSKWNAQEQTWVAEYITVLGSYNFDMLMGEGAFVFVSEQSQWQVEPWWWV